jgi:hypothetical protein
LLASEAPIDPLTKTIDFNGGNCMQGAGQLLTVFGELAYVLNLKQRLPP